VINSAPYKTNTEQTSLDNTSIHSTDNSNDDKSIHRATEDIQFIEFAKHYIGLLATVTAIPILAEAIGVLNPPVNNDKLKFLSSFLCLLAFAMSFLLKGLLSRLTLSKNLVARLIPFTLALSIVVSCIYFTSIYDYTSRTDHLQKIYYLSIYPLFVFALGIVLVTSFTQQRSQTIQAVVDARLHEEQKYILETISNYAAFRELSTENSSLAGVGQELISRRDLQLSRLSKGQVEVRGTETTHIQELLLRNFNQRFDAVSDRDLAFWTLRDDNQIAHDYITLMLGALQDGTTVTRIFIVTDEDLENNADTLIEVLNKQDKVGIGWAVAIYEELGPLTKDGGVAIDFAILENTNKQKVVTFFRDYRDLSRKFIAIFDTKNNKQQIQRQEAQYRRILSQCWMANKRFKELRKDILDGPSQLSGSNNHTRDRSLKEVIKTCNEKTRTRIGPHNQHEEDIFLIETQGKDDIRDAVERLKRARSHSKKYFIYESGLHVNSDLSVPQPITRRNSEESSCNRGRSRRFGWF